MKKELSGGLILRSLSEGVATDAERLPTFYRDVFKDDGDDDADALIPWTQDIIDAHPKATQDDIWVIVDPAADDKIVSALLLIPHTWRCGDVQLPVGQIEIVATDKAYRRRGLIRELFTVAHDRSVKLGHVMQFIGGIPYFYRQFGYAMALDLGTRHSVAFFTIPPLKEDDQPDFTLRPATHDDIPDLMSFDDYYAHHFTNFTTHFDESTWRYELGGKRKGAMTDRHVLMIVDKEDKAVGYILCQKNLIHRKHRLECLTYVVGSGASYLATYADVIRGLNAFVKTTYPDNDVEMVSFSAGITQALDILVNMTFPSATLDMAYAWYLRVPDYVALLEPLKPVLEKRLQGSAAHGYTGDFKIGFYKKQYLKLVFEQGRITSITTETMTDEDRFHAQFPDLTFISVLFGYRTIEELKHVYVDLQAGRTGKVLLEALFPRQRSDIYMTG